MSIYRVAEHEEVNHESPKELVEKVIALEEEILQDLKEIKSKIK
jgi:tRNA(Ser,Leu) C12 N-acetylase TAN1